MRPDTRSWSCPACGQENEEGASAPTGIPTGDDRRRFAMIAGVVVVLAILVGIFVFSGDDDPADDPAVQAAISQLCSDIPRDQAIRTDALRRTGQKIATDADALREAGADDLAADADALSAIYLELSDATAAAEDTAELFDELIGAIDALPC
jgi:hypothetical protein